MITKTFGGRCRDFVETSSQLRELLPQTVARGIIGPLNELTYAALANPSEYIGPEQLVPHAKRSDAMHDLGDDEADQVGVGHWALYVLSTGLVLTGIAMIVLGWF